MYSFNYFLEMINIKDIVSCFLGKISAFIPQRKVLCFDSYPDYTDNPYALFMHIIHDETFKDFKCVWLIGRTEKYNYYKNIIKKDLDKVLVVKKRSLEGMYYMLICRFYFCSHGLSHTLIFKQKKPKIINMWHGMPLKAIGAMDDVFGSTYENSDIMVATNDFFADILSKCFLLSREKVLSIGQPRNDLFNCSTNFFDLYKVNKGNYSSIGAWLPTFRKNAYTENRTDGTYLEGHISFFSPQMLIRLDKDLQLRNALLIIKLHPMDAMNSYNFPQYENIIIVKNNSPLFQLYPMLGKMDYLLTDYSSVFVDFDILNKPIGFTINDLEEYRNNRGFIVEDVEEFIGGPIISTYELMLNFLDKYKDMRINTGTKYNKYKDFNSSKRLLDYLRTKI